MKDPETAEILAPKTYPIGTKRICIDSGYFETYNRDNVDLIDISETLIKRITPTGLIANDQTYEFDSIVFATGFDAMTGTLFNVDIRGRDDLALKEKWYAGPRTYLGLMSEAFPNLFMITGPGSPSVKSNMMVSIEQHVDFVTESIVYMRDRELELMEPELASEDEWPTTFRCCKQDTLPRANSWYMGANIPENRASLCLILWVGTYRRKCE